MKLSNRTWRAVARRLEHSLEPAQAMVWAKIEQQARGKRHALITIPLSVDEEIAVLHELNNPQDDYMRFVIEHERNINPWMPA